MDTKAFLQSVKANKRYKNQITHVESIPARTAQYSNIEPPISGEVGDALINLGIERLYSHQAEAIKAVRDGQDIVVVTSTASGKTLCYNVPVLEYLQNDTDARALYIYPTKALAQDQLGKLRQYQMPFLNAAAYDGDTPKSERPYIKALANVVLTNPDMLHVGILPYHTTWAKLFRNLKFIVIDEIHMYKGVFGSHVANVIRRLRRIAAYYGSRPQFICASATVKEPDKLVKNLIGVEARVIDNDGSPSGAKTLAFWNPPCLNDSGDRRSTNSEAVDIFVSLIASGIRTIVFTKARKTAELILRYSKTALNDMESPNTDKIMSYRAGYRPQERREIEKKLFSGELLGVTSTTALEVGVDIGGLDAVVLTGYPGTVASMWQQIGRAGRGVEESLAFLVAYNDPIDQYIIRNPQYFLSSEHERTIVDPANPYILAEQMLCAANEIPIENSEVEEMFGKRGWELLGLLANAGELNFRRRWYWTGNDYPAWNVNIRSTSGDGFNIVSIDHGGQIMGTVDESTAYETIHPGAVYLHAGESYVVTRLDVEEKTAYVERSDVNYYTTPGSRMHVLVKEKAESDFIGDVEICFGDVEVTSLVTHFWRKQLFTEEVLSKTPLDLPEVTLNTESAWIIIPEEITLDLIKNGYDLAGSIHAAEHVSIGIMPLFAICDRNDIGGVSHPEHPDTDSKAAIFIYDGHEGGVGLARAAYDTIQGLLNAALNAMEECECRDGCPSCVQSPKCGNNNDPLDKAGAIYLLNAILSSADTGQ